MAANDKRVSQFTELTGVADGDLLGIVDVSDTSQSTAGSTKKITKANLVADLASKTETLTNKTIDADSNTIQDLTVSNLKAGVLDTDLSTVSATDNTIPSAKATKAYVDAHGGAVDSVNGQTGVVVLDQDDIGDGSTYVQTENNLTDALKTKLDNTNEDAEVATVVAGDNIDVDATDSENPIVSLEGDINVNSIKLDNSPSSVPDEAGVISWNSTDKTANLNTGEGVTLQLNQEEVTWVKATEDISNGELVYIDGADSNLPTVSLAKADASDTSINTIAMATQDILTGNSGFVTRTGYVRDINTNGFAAGTELFLSATTAGAFTDTAPDAPHFVVRVGHVTKSGTSDGVVLVDIMTIPGARNINTHRLDNNATYSRVQDYIDQTGSAGWVDGGVFSDNGDGTMAVTAGQGLIRETNDGNGRLVWFDWPANTSLAVTEDVTSYISVDYNSGTPQLRIDTSNVANGQTIFNLGLVFREGLDLHFFRAGQSINEGIRKIIQRFNAEGMVQIISGGLVAETSTRYLTVTGAVLYGGITKFTTSAIDTSGTDTFEYYYTDGLGGWQYLNDAATQINNTQYDNGGTLTNLTANKYRTDWVYLSNDGDLLVMLGTNNESLTDAQTESPPSSLPPHIANFSTLIAKVIVQQGATNLAEVDNVETIAFSSSGTVVHNDTTGIQGGTTNQYYHLTSAQHTDLTDGGDSTLHYHSTDRARANHTGTQLASTISDFDEAAQDAVGGILTDSPEIDFTYTDGTPEITASIVASSIDESKLDSSVNASLDLADSALQAIADDSITEPKLAMNDSPADGEVIAYNSTGGYMEWVPQSGGSGDISGPASSTDSAFALWDGTGGDTLKDSATTITTTLGTPGLDTKIPTEKAVRAAISGAGGGDVSGPASSVDDRIATFDGTTGKLIQDGGKTIAETLARANHTGTQTASTISDFDTEVSNNTDVAANTSARHSAATVSDTNSVDMSITGQEISADVKVDDSTVEIDAINGVQVKNSGITNAKLAGSITIDKIESTDKSGLDDTLVTGTAGVNGNLAQWNADGDIIDSGNATTQFFNYSTDDMDDISNGTTYVKTENNLTDTLKNKLDGIEESADVTDAGNVGSAIDTASAKTTPVDADTMPLIDSAAANVLKKITWANIKAAIKSYYDSVSSTLTNKTIDGDNNTISDIATSSLKTRAGTGSKVLTTDDDGSHGEELIKFNADGEAEASGVNSATVITESGSQTLTNKTLTSPAINTGISGTAFLDEDNMASDSATKVASQQSIKAYVDNNAPADGWIPAGETWVYSDSDLFYISGVNLTDKYNQTGLKIKLTNASSTKYFEVVSATYTSGNTYVSLYGYGTYSLANSAISNPYYSMVEYPRNHPIKCSNVQVYSSTGLANITDSTATLIPFDTETFDDTNDFNTSTNTFTAPLDGDYTIIIQAAASGVATDDKFETSVYKNGSKTIAAILEANAGSNYFHLQNVSNLRLDAGDTIKAYVAFYGSAGTCDLRSESNLTFMRITLNRRV